MDNKLLDDLTVCLDELESGADLQEIVAQFPENREQLLGLLGIARDLRDFPVQPLVVDQKKAKEKFLQDAAALSSRRVRRKPFSRFIRVMAPVLGLVLILFGFTSSLVAVAQNSIPGDFLYSTKLTLEETQIWLSPPEIHKKLRADFAQERIEEVREALRKEREVMVQIQGVIDSATEEQITVAGLIVLLEAETVVEGDLFAGATAVITAKTVNGQIIALQINVDGADPVKNSPNLVVTNTPAAPLETREPTAVPKNETQELVETPESAPEPTDEPTPLPTNTPPPPPPPTQEPAPTPDNEGEGDEDDNQNNNESEDDDNGDDSSDDQSGEDSGNDHGDSAGGGDDDANENEDDDSDASGGDDSDDDNGNDNSDEDDDDNGNDNSDEDEDDNGNDNSDEDDGDDDGNDNSDEDDNGNDNNDEDEDDDNDNGEED